MERDRRQLIDFISIVSDGKQVNWDEASSEVEKDEELQLLQNLRAVQAIGQIHVEQELSPENSHKRGSSDSDASQQATLLASRYRLLRKIGRGGMGIVWEALDTYLRRHVALKVLPLQQAGQTRSRRRFIREARIAAGLNHPNICTIHEIGETERDIELPTAMGLRRLQAGTPFIAMELIDGITLTQKLDESGPLEIGELKNIAMQIAVALGEAHKHNIVHRDLKPGNVMLTTDGRAKILDFGLARPINTKDKVESNKKGLLGDGDDLTVAGAVMGTCSYMSPEQAQCKALDARSDVFSFGIMLYELATGRRPFPGEDTEAIRANIIECSYVPPSRLNNKLSPRVDHVVFRCLSRDPDDRYADGQDLIEALKTIGPTEKSGISRLLTGNPKSLALALSLGVVIVTILIAGSVMPGYWLRLDSEKGTVSPFTDEFERTPLPNDDPEYTVFNFDEALWDPDKSPGHLTLWTHQGDTWNENGIGMPAKNIVALPVTDKNFTVTTKLDEFFPHKDWQQAGLLVFQDLDNYVRLTVLSDLIYPKEGPVQIQAVAGVYERGDRVLEQSDKSRATLGANPPFHSGPFVPRTIEHGPIDEIWLSITRSEDTWTLRYSYDGNGYEVLERITFPLKTEWVGLFAIHGIGHGDTPDLTWDPIPARFDFIEIEPYP